MHHCKRTPKPGCRGQHAYCTDVLHTALAKNHFDLGLAGLSTGPHGVQKNDMRPPREEVPEVADSAPRLCTEAIGCLPKLAADLNLHSQHKEQAREGLPSVCSQAWAAV
eukprot:1943423-Amphidinium_carterae.1